MHSSPKIPRVALLALGGVVAGVLVATTVLLGGGSDPGPMAGERPQDAAPDAAAVPYAAPLPDAVAVEEEAGGDIDRTAVDTSVIGDGPRLKVVEAVTSRPVAGATVFFADERVVRSGRRGWDQAGWIDRLLDSAARVVADANGEVVLPVVERRLFVAAQTEGLFGVTTVQPGAEEATLTLVRDQTVTVRVTDAEGRPRAGVDVVLAIDRIQRLEPRRSAPTDENGIAVMRHVQLFRVPMPQVDPATLARIEQLTNRIATAGRTVRAEAGVTIRVREGLRIEFDRSRQELRRVSQAVRDRIRRQRAESPGAAPTVFADFVVAARVPQLSPAVVRFPGNAVPERIIELRLDGLGALELRLVGPDGEPLWTPCRVELSRSGANPIPGTVRPALVDGLGRLSKMQIAKPVGEGSVRFDPVGAGVTLDVAIRFADNDFQFQQAGIPGPFAGEERVVEIVVPDWFAVLTGRLVDGEGRPWSELRTDLLVTGATGRIEGERVTTDVEGRFELPVRVKRPAPPYALEIQARRGDERVGTLVEVALLRPGRRHDLGDVLVAGLPVLAVGTVSDDRGAPLGGVDLLLQTFRPDAGDRGSWQDIAFVRARSEADGTFRLFGERRGDRMRVRASARGHARVNSPEIPFGASVNLTLTRLGELVVTGHAPEWLPRGAVQLVLLRDGRRVRGEDLRFRRDGVFRVSLRGLEPGVYDLACTLRNIGTVFEQPGIVVVPGDRTTVPELDLRDAVFRYVVRVVDQQGRPLRDPGSPLLAQVVNPAGQPRWVPFPWRGDRVEFFSSSRAAVVVALASGRRPIRIEIAPGESRLTMPRLQPIELEFPGLRAMVGERRVRISLVFEGDTGFPMSDLRATDQSRGRSRSYQRASLGKSGGAWLGKNDIVRVPLMLNGRYRVIARISQPGKRAGVSKRIGTVNAVLDGPDVRRVVVPTPGAIVQQAIVELESR